MPTFTIGQPITTADPVIEVESTGNTALPVGRHVFQLVVVDDAGNVSDPARAEIVVLDTEKPTAIIDAPGRIGFGNNFPLDGRKSFDPPPGKIVRYIWTLVE